MVNFGTGESGAKSAMEQASTQRRRLWGKDVENAKEKAGGCSRRAEQKRAHLVRAEAKTTGLPAGARCAKTATALAKSNLYKPNLRELFARSVSLAISRCAVLAGIRQRRLRRESSGTLSSFPCRRGQAPSSHS